MEGAGIGLFRHPDLEHFEGKVAEIADSLRPYAKGGAWIEEKGPTLTFHTHDLAEEERGEVLEEVRQLIRESGFVSREIYSCVEARPPIGWDKGQAVMHLMRQLHGRDWAESVRVIYIGDDETDEDAFRALSGLGVTFRVGSPDTPTAATRRLAHPETVRAFLTWLVNRRSIHQEQGAGGA
jgi:trehalose-phosphatase